MFMFTREFKPWDINWPAQTQKSSFLLLSPVSRSVSGTGYVTPNILLKSVTTVLVVTGQFCTSRNPDRTITSKELLVSKKILKWNTVPCQYHVLLSLSLCLCISLSLSFSVSVSISLCLSILCLSLSVCLFPHMRALNERPFLVKSCSGNVKFSIVGLPSPLAARYLPQFPVPAFQFGHIGISLPFMCVTQKPGKEKETHHLPSAQQLFSPSYLSRTPAAMPLFILGSMHVTGLQFHSQGTGSSTFLAVARPQPDRINAFISDVRHLEPKWS